LGGSIFIQLEEEEEEENCCNFFVVHGIVAVAVGQG
jgi:hypothetical protein